MIQGLGPCSQNSGNPSRRYEGLGRGLALDRGPCDHYNQVHQDLDQVPGDPQGQAQEQAQEQAQVHQDPGQIAGIEVDFDIAQDVGSDAEDAVENAGGGVLSCPVYSVWQEIYEA